MEVSLQITSTDAQIEESILQEFRAYLQAAFQGSIDAISRRVRERVVELVNGCDEVTSLKYGILRQELGLEDAEQTTQKIAQTIADNAYVKLVPITVRGRGLEGGIALEVLKSDYSDLLNLPGVTYITKNGFSVPWLEWLLFSGDTMVLIGYEILYNPNKPGSSRTGPIMVPSKKKPGWKVPANFSGTTDDNFLTRALRPLENELQDIIEQEVNRRL